MHFVQGYKLLDLFLKSLKFFLNCKIICSRSYIKLMKTRTAWVVHCILRRVSLLGCRIVPCNDQNQLSWMYFLSSLPKLSWDFYTKRGSSEWVWRNFEPISRQRVDVDPVGKYQAHVVHITYSRSNCCDLETSFKVKWSRS